MSSTTSWTEPTPEDVNTALSLVGRVEQFRYFLDRLENPRWVKPLADRRVFASPQGPLVDEDDKSVRYPPWPPSRFLARMAAHAEVHADVAEVALSIETDNFRIHEDLAEVATKLDPSSAARFVEKAVRWVEGPNALRLPETLGKLVRHLALGGEVKPALKLAKALLAVQPDPRSSDDLERSYRHPEPRARFELYVYGEVLGECRSALLQAAGIEAINLLSGLLQRAVTLSFRDSDRDPPEDVSYFWRPAIEDHAQNHNQDVRELLVSAVRDSALEYAQQSDDSLVEVVDVLEARPWRIFHRIALHLLRVHCARGHELVHDRVRDPSRFECPGIHREYFHLIQAGFDSLPVEGKEEVLAWIDQGPDLETFKVSPKEFHGRDATEEDAQKYKGYWQLQRLTPIAAVLNGDWRDRFERLTAELGPVEHPDFLSYTSSGVVSPGSPFDKDELSALEDDELVQFLTDWVPPKDPESPTREGLGRNLESAVSGDPLRFASAAHRFKDDAVDPTFIRALLRGLIPSVKASVAIDWARPLELCRWVVNKPRSVEGRSKSQALVEDPDWGRTRDAILALLEAGFSEQNHEIPVSLSSDVWAILASLSEDPDPSATRDKESSGADSFSLAINSTRPSAIQGVIRYVFWVRRGAEEVGDSTALQLTPEAREVLEQHLDSEQDGSRAVRAMYGHWFPWLLLLDEQWASDHASRIFNSSEGQGDLLLAAWETYVIFCHPYDNVLQHLHDQYAAAIERIESSESIQRPRDPDQSLGEHLLTFFWRGALTLEEDDLPPRFFAKASDDLRGHTIDFVGRSLAKTEQPLDGEIRRRLEALWASRLAAAHADPQEFGKELSRFGWWFASSHFDETWSLERLEEGLLLVGAAEPDHMVVERLAALSEAHPRRATTCLRLMLEGDTEGWAVLSFRDHASTILANALNGPDLQAQTDARALINALGAQGQMAFRELLK